MVVSNLEHWLSVIWSQSPVHLVLEVLLIVAIVILLLRKPEPIETNELTEAEENSLIAEWTPLPIVPDEDPEADQSILTAHTVTSGPSDTIEVDGKRVMNFGTPNFFGLSMNQEIIDSAIAAIDHYAVGACGPRQFYGTMDAHLNVESAMANWLGTEDSVNYCYPFATTTSIMQALVHNTDVLFIDEGSWFAIELGAALTRSNVVVFKHNDMADLRDKIRETKGRFKRWEKCNRWVAVEGLYANDGSIVDLPSLIQLRREFCLRIIIDETYSFGALGKTGKGVCELFDEPRELVEVSIGSYGSAFASLGGFTVGSKEISSHQRLASHAYIFSASPPCFNAVAASKAIEIVTKDGEERCKKLRENTLLARNELKAVQGFEVLGDETSPIIHLRLTNPQTIHEEDILLQNICEKCLEEQDDPVAICKSKFTRNREKKVMRPTLKFYVSPAHSEEQIRKAAATIKRVASSLIQ